MSRVKDFSVSEGWKKAFKKHVCKACGQDILRGHRYWRLTGDGEPVRDKDSQAGAYCNEDCKSRGHWKGA